MISNNSKLILLSFFTILFLNAYSQDDIASRHCGTYEYNSTRTTFNRNSFRQNFDAKPEEKKTEAIKTHLVSDSIFTIPVVVHVVYHSNSENIADQQIESQIEVLNEDYSGTNLDIVNVPDAFKGVKAGDIGIRFCLATLDPNNQPTKGIIRTYTDNTQFDFADDVKFTDKGGSDAWPSDKYLNIWVCNLTGSLLGYAQYPGSGADSTDGVVIFYKAFGRNGTAVKPYNKGRTLTHEVGHWLDLLHIWGDDGTDCTGSDKVSDTPNQAGSTYGCPSYPQNSCGNAQIGGDMFMNYMDYTNDSCMCIFTAGQKARMIDALDTYRLNLKISAQTDCSPLNATPDYAIAILPNPNNGFFNIRFKKSIPESLQISVYDMLGHEVYSGYKGNIDTDIETGIENRNLYINCNYLAKGMYFLKTEIEGRSYVYKVVIFKN